MNLIDNDLYISDINKLISLELPWEKLKDSSILLSGATGLIGSFLVDVIGIANKKKALRCHIYALGRSEQRAKDRFSYIYEDENSNNYFTFIPYDINKPFERDDIGDVDYILHLASNTHPLQYSTDPIGTITTNIIGTQNMLDFAFIHNAKRMAFASSNEVYGENRGDTEFFSEDYCGYIDSNTLRAGYPESKRCGEALCQAYIKQKGMDIVIPRFTRSYGPTMLMSDSKVISQFIRKGLAGEDIVLKSEGNQYYSYTYVADAVSGLLTILLKGKCGEAYNIADEASDITLRDLAKLIADKAGKKVVFDLPDEIEAAGYSKATKARLAGSKLKKLGWEPMYDINGGIIRTMNVMRK